MTADNTKCRLCGQPGFEAIDIFGPNGLKLSIAPILVQHFKFELLEDDCLSKIVCKLCWRTTDEFHKLYCNVQEYMAKLQGMVIGIKEEDYPNFSDYPQYENIIIETDKVADFNPNITLDTMFKTEDTSEENYKTVTTNVNIICDDKSQTFKSTVKLIKSKKKTRKQVADSKILSTQRKRIEEMDSIIADTLGIVCEICGMKTGNFTNLMKHYRDKHKTDGFIKCCDRSFSKRHKLYNHVQNHRCPDRFKCYVCGKKFIDKFYFNRHIKNHDPSSKTFQCSDCPKRYDYQKLLDLHYTQTHCDKPKPFICDLCDKGFHSKHSIAAHLVAMHTERSLFICDICAKIFKSRLQVDIHYKKKHQGIVSPKFQCTICDAWLASKRGLKYHINRLHEAIEVGCTICAKVCPNKEALVKHIKFVHSGRSFPCHMCEKTCKSQVSLKEHISTHTGFSLYKCVYCLVEFKSNANMYKHRKNAHPIEWQLDRDRRLKAKAN